MSEIRKPIDWTKPLQTKGGERRTLLPGRRWNDEFPRIVASASGVEFIHRENGEVFGPCRNRDLINVPEPAEAVDDHDDLRERVSKIEDRLAAIERDDEPPRLDDAFPIPPTAERESEPTPGMVAAAEEVIYASGGSVAAEIINRHVGPELSALRAESERLKARLSEQVKAQHEYAEQFDADIRAKFAHMGWELPKIDGPIWQAVRQFLTVRLAELARLKDDYQVAVNNIGYRNEELNEARAEIERLKALDKDYCDSANKYAQEIGNLRQQLTAKDVEIERQRKIINDNFASTAERVAELEQQLATHREAAEAMEWLTEHDYGLACLYSPNGDTPATFKKFWRIELLQERFPTPTAAILAARDASGTNTGEK